MDKSILTRSLAVTLLASGMLLSHAAASNLQGCLRLRSNIGPPTTV